MPETTKCPNILLIMSDEHAPQFSSTYGHPFVQTPNLDRLATNGVVFENAYCNTPLCAPSRMSFMTGRYIHHINTWDNATPLASDAVTWAHLARSVGYDVVLAGKQHFIGPDQLHGFQAQLARDLHAESAHAIYDWADGIVPTKQPWPALAKAGPGTTTEIEVDDAVEEASLAFLRDPARRDKPWILNASFIAPHFPLIVPDEFYSLYSPEQVDLPTIPPGHLDTLHPVYQRMRQSFGLIDFPEEMVRRGRAAYYGLVTYLDAKIGRLLQAIEETGQSENTLVIYTSDHGEMAGEHGMWRKSNFYEYASRVPLLLSWPGQLPADRRVSEVVSLVDLIASVVEASGATPVAPLDGDSLLPLARGEGHSWKNEAFAEYLAHGVTGPMAMLRQGQYKLNYSLGDPPELYDLASDPGEFHNLAADPAYRQVVDDLRTRLLAHWNPIDLERQVRQSQRERALIRSVGALPGQKQHH